MSRHAPWRGVIEEYRDRLPVARGHPGGHARRGRHAAGRPRRYLSERTGCEVYLKVEGLNPTGSFKDRGMTMAISMAARPGAKAVICASTGNTSASAAAYAARAGMTCARARAGGQDRAGQARPGDRARRQAAAGRRQLRRLPDAGPQAAPRPTRSRWSTRSTRTASRARRPPRSRSCDALGDAPDIHCLPVGNAGNITAYWKGYREYPTPTAWPGHALPRMFGFQAAGAAPIVLGAPGRPTPRPSPPRSGSATRRPGRRPSRRATSPAA